MPSTDIDGSHILILSEDDAICIRNILISLDELDGDEIELQEKVNKFIKACHESN